MLLSWFLLFLEFFFFEFFFVSQYHRRTLSIFLTQFFLNVFIYVFIYYFYYLNRLAIGTSVPDALGSMIVARAGEADMAIANAVGSNVFDILLGLGFPWFLRGVINDFNDDPCDDYYPVKKCGIEISVAILFGTLGIFFLVLILYKWRMNNKLGITFLIVYFIYILWILLTAFPSGNPVISINGGCQEPLPPSGCPGNLAPIVNSTR